MLLSLWLQHDLFIRWLNLNSLRFEILLELSQVRVVDEVLGIATRWDKQRFFIVDIRGESKVLVVNAVNNVAVKHFHVRI